MQLFNLLLQPSNLAVAELGYLCVVSVPFGSLSLEFEAVNLLTFCLDAVVELLLLFPLLVKDFQFFLLLFQLVGYICKLWRSAFSADGFLLYLQLLYLPLDFVYFFRY